MKLVAGIDLLNIPQRFEAAEKRIILHAAVYGPFAESRPHREGLERALSRPSFEGLDVIGLTADRVMPWQASFFGVLRFGRPVSDMASEIHDSQGFLESLSRKFPDMVRIHAAGTYPCMPVLIVDNTLMFGQYAHAELPAPQGYWGVVEADVDALMDWAKQGDIPGSATADERAAYRLVRECFHAMKGENNE